jgi:hypothetical protein
VGVHLRRKNPNYTPPREPSRKIAWPETLGSCRAIARCLRVRGGHPGRNRDRPLTPGQPSAERRSRSWHLTVKLRGRPGAPLKCRGHTVFQRSRRVTTRHSRAPPTIVSRQGLESRVSIPSKKRIQIAASGKPIASMPIRSDKRPIGEHRHGSLGENCGLQPVIPRTYPTATITAGMTTTTVRTIANQKSTSRFP